MDDLDLDLNNGFLEENLEDLKSKITHEYDFGVKRSNSMPEDISDEIELLYYIRQHKGPIMINVNLDVDNYHLTYTILNK